MNKTKIVLDSTSTYDLIENPIDAEILRLIVIFDGKEYVDGVDLTPEDFYKMLKADKNVLPSTSQPTVGRTVEQFEKLKEEGYTDLVVLTISSKLSGTYGTTVSAAEMVDGINVHVVDTRTLVLPLYQLGEIAARMAARDKDPKEIAEYIESIKDEFHIYVAIGDLTLLRKNGRLSSAQAMVGNILKVKPVIQVNEEGVLETVHKVRTMKKALELLADTFFNKNINVSDVTILHSDCYELATEFRSMLGNVDSEYEDIQIYLMTPVIGAHTGAGSVGITYRKRRKE